MNGRKIKLYFFCLMISLHTLQSSAATWQQRVRKQAQDWVATVKDNPKVSALFTFSAVGAAAFGVLACAVFSKKNKSPKLLAKETYQKYFKECVLPCVSYNTLDETQKKLVFQDYMIEIFENSAYSLRERLISENATLNDPNIMHDRNFLSTQIANVFDIVLKQLNGEQQKRIYYNFYQKIKIIQSPGSYVLSYENFNAVRELFVKALPFVDEDFASSSLLRDFVLDPLFIVDNRWYFSSSKQADMEAKLDGIIDRVYDVVCKNNLIY